MKFELYKSEETNEYFFRLKAGNGQVILTSEAHQSKDSCKKAIDAVIKNAVSDDNFIRNETNDGQFYFRLRTPDLKVIGTSKLYASRLTCERGVKAVKHTALDAIMLDLAK